MSERLIRMSGWLVVGAVLLAMPLYLDTAWLTAGQYMMIGAVGAIGLTLLTGQGRSPWRTVSSCSPGPPGTPSFPDPPTTSACSGSALTRSWR